MADPHADVKSLDPSETRGVAIVAQYVQMLEGILDQAFPGISKDPTVAKMLQEIAPIVAKQAIEANRNDVEVEIVEMAARDAVITLGRHQAGRGVQLSAAGLSAADMVAANFKDELLKNLRVRLRDHTPADNGVNAKYAKLKSEYDRKPETWQAAGYETAEQYANYNLTGDMNTPPAGLST